MVEKANIIVEIDEEWFEKNAIVAAFYFVTKVSRAFTIERTFARFQNEEDASMFEEYYNSK